MAHPLFKKLTTDTTTCLLSLGKVLMLDDQILYKQDDAHNEKFYLVIFGWLQLTKTKEKGDKFAKFGAGSFVAANWMFDSALEKTGEKCNSCGEAALIEFDNKQWGTVK